MAASYHQLGRMAQDRGDLTVAENWYRKSLEINEALGNRPGKATTYCVLGLLVLLRHIFLREFRGKLRAHAGHRGSRAWPIA